MIQTINTEIKEKQWTITKEKANYLLNITVASIFGCYEGPKNAQDLIDNPNTIESSDFEHIALPWQNVKIARETIHDLLVILKIQSTTTTKT